MPLWRVKIEFSAAVVEVRPMRQWPYFGSYVFLQPSRRSDSISQVDKFFLRLAN